MVRSSSPDLARSISEMLYPSASNVLVSFELQSDGENTQPDLRSYKPTYLPDGAELQNTVELPEFYGYEYAIDDTAYFSIWLSQSDIRIYIDAENADVPKPTPARRALPTVPE